MIMELRLRPQHARVFSCEKRFIVLVAGRRWGKTTLALWWLINEAFRGPDRIYYYVAPTCRQAKRIAWRKLKSLVPPDMRRVTREDELELELCNGSIIQLHGASNADSLRGIGLDAIVLDEYAYMPSDLWNALVRPMLSDRRGRALFIGTPAGHNGFYELWVATEGYQDSAAFRFATRDGGYVADEELAAIRCETDERVYRQEYEASFESLQGRVYSAFCRESHVTDLDMVLAARLHIGMDFNISPMTAVVAQRAGDQCHVIDEIVLPDSNTQQMMQEINRRYPMRNGVIHPDPSGIARKTSAPVGQNDFVLIQQAGWPIYPPKNRSLSDRITNVNTMLRNANGQHRLFIDRKCRNLIGALDTLSYKPGTKIPDPTTGLIHIIDALGYLIVAAFPMVHSGVTVTEVLL
jgi:hypothetical protein